MNECLVCGLPTLPRIVTMLPISQIDTPDCITKKPCNTDMLTSGTKNTMLGGWGWEEGPMHLYPGSLSEISGLLGVPVTFSEVKTIFRMTQRHDLFFSLCWHLHSWCKSNCAGASALIIKAVAANGTSHCILLRTISNFLKKPVSFTKVLNETSRRNYYFY